MTEEDMPYAGYYTKFYDFRDELIEEFPDLMFLYRVTFEDFIKFAYPFKIRTYDYGGVDVISFRTLRNFKVYCTVMREYHELWRTLYVEL